MDNARIMHPREMIFLLRGKKTEKEVCIKDYLLPPFAFHGSSSSGYNPYMLPLDLSIMGSVHSHPSGVLKPSITDLNNLTGLFTLIIAWPYDGPRDVAAFNRDGEVLRLET